MATDAALGLYSEETEDAMFSHFGKEVDTLKKEIKKVQANIKSQNVRLKTLDGEIKELNKELDVRMLKFCIVFQFEIVLYK